MCNVAGINKRGLGRDMASAYKTRKRVLAQMQLQGYSYEEASERYSNMMEALRIMAEEGIDTNSASLEETRDAFEMYNKIKRLI